VYAFGSYATGFVRLRSDLDALVVRRAFDVPVALDVRGAARILERYYAPTRYQMRSVVFRRAGFTRAPTPRMRSPARVSSSPSPLAS